MAIISFLVGFLAGLVVALLFTWWVMGAVFDGARSLGSDE